MPLRLLVDAELLTVNWLRGHADVTALVATRVYTEVPAQPVYPLLRVIRIGGVPMIAQHLDIARVQIDAWAATKKAARDLAATAQAAMHELPGARPLGVVTAVEDDLGFTWSPDDATDQPRYVFGVSIYIHPNL